MSSFDLFPNTPYTISVAQPSVAGNPAPTISYRWTYEGVEIGTTRVVHGYTFPSFPGELFCTVTATNWGGTVSQTAAASIFQRQPKPELNPISIRLESLPTQAINAFPSASVGDVLVCGGPLPGDLAPTGITLGTITYQWRRNGLPISGATGQTYRLVANDINQTISVVVTATLGTDYDTASAVLYTGTAAANANSRIGGHGPDVNYYTASVGFANLTHAMVPFNPQGATTSDGWSHGAQNYLFAVGPQSRLSMLGIQGSWDSANVAYQDSYTTEYGISESYRVRYKITVYWEGSQGKAVVRERGLYGGAGDSSGSLASPQYPQSWEAYSPSTVQFACGDPFGDGATRSFYKRTTAFGPVSVRGGLRDHNLAVYANGATDPFRNAIILVHDVQREVGGVNSGVWETVYAGFTHENYTPFALYPTYVEAVKHLKTLRYLTFGWAHQAEWAISQSTGESITGTNYPYSDSWYTPEQNAAFSEYRDLPPTIGTAFGFAALNRPTHIYFGRSIRAACEICSILGCDLWWNHPFHSTYVGNTPGEVKVREGYVQLFAETVNQHLAPGLQVYSEWGNETWNYSNPYLHGLRYAQNQGLRMTNANGDLVLRNYSHLWPSGAPWWVNTAAPDIAMFAYNAASAATISARLRPLMPGREVVSVWASQDGNGSIRGEVQRAAFSLWHTLPWVFDELDAYAVAPYRTPPVDNAAVEAGTLTPTAAFDAIHSAGWLLPASDPASRWHSTTLAPPYDYANIGKPGFVQQKQFCLDLLDNYSAPADLGKRRWNLRLIAYECGQHATPSTAATKDFTRRLQYEPRYYDFYYRHYETLLSPGPSPMTTTRQPDGYFGLKSQFIANGEPLYDMVCDLSPISGHVSSYFWGTQQFNGEIGAPRATALRDLVIDQPWNQSP